MIDGIRGEPFSLIDCVNCHAQTTADGTPIRIDAEGQFCESCHAFAAVKIDCFTCHAAKPEQSELIGKRLPAEPVFGSSPVFGPVFGLDPVSGSGPGVGIDSLYTALAVNDNSDKWFRQRESFDQYLNAIDNFTISADAYFTERDGRQSKANR